MTGPEQVVLLDERGRSVGTALKAEVHSRRTPLHLAFSCYLFDGSGSVLLTRRALHKRTWPGVWTNAFCGHPAPGEALEQAVRRRAAQELGTGLDELQLVLPGFRYRAEMADGTCEHEMCPVYVARAVGPVAPAVEEVAEVAWVDWVRLRADVLAGRSELSPWCLEQIRQLVEVETADGVFHAAPASKLPPAARR